MSYVIQNFYECTRKVSSTPRLKSLLLLNNVEKFLVFIKFNTFLYSINRLNLFNFNHFFLFLKYFFSKQYIKLIYKSDLSLVGNYTNSLTKSALYWIWATLENFIKNKKFIFSSNYYKTEFLYNHYFLSLKTFNIKITKCFYKNIFYYFLMISPFMWYQRSSSVRFYLNFIHVPFILKIFRFSGTYFLKIYSH